MECDAEDEEEGVVRAAMGDAAQGKDNSTGQGGPTPLHGAAAPRALAGPSEAAEVEQDAQVGEDLIDDTWADGLRRAAAPAAVAAGSAGRPRQKGDRVRIVEGQYAGRTGTVVGAGEAVARVRIDGAGPRTKLAFEPFGNIVREDGGGSSGAAGGGR
eukprot:1170436-Pyramimonas_sp.AAC.1